MAFEYAVVLTGSIATGKSTAAKILASLGFMIIDADKISHQVLEEQAKRIVEIFGDKILNEAKVDRKALGQIVFSDSKKRKQLEDLLHPLIYKEIKKQAMQLEVLAKPYLIDIPLFFEGDRYPIEKSLVVYTPEKLQKERLMAREDCSEEEADNRIKMQLPIEEKRAAARYVIDNSGTLTQLKQECERVKEEILNDSN